MPAAGAVPSPAALAKAGYAKVQLSFSFQRGASQSTRSRQFIDSNATASFTANVNGGKPSIFNCTNASLVQGVALYTCSGSVNAPLNQADTFVVNTYDGPNGTGYLLSTNAPGGNTAAVLPNQQNNVNITTQGVVASVAPLFSCAQGGTYGSYATHIPLQFLDADGGVISGPLSAGGTGTQQCDPSADAFSRGCRKRRHNGRVYVARRLRRAGSTNSTSRRLDRPRGTSIP